MNTSEHFELDRSIRRSIRFADVMQMALVEMNPDRKDASLRIIAATSLAKVATANCDGGLRLFRLGIYTPAFALVRPEFEAALRSSWVRFAASEEWVSAFMRPIPETETREPEEFPKIFRMLEELKSSSLTPEHLHFSLHTLKEKAIDVMNSFTHGGLRQVTRAAMGYELEMIYWMLRTTCSLRFFASQLIASHFENPRCNNRLSAIRNEYADCMHT